MDGRETRWHHRTIEDQRHELGADVARNLMKENHSDPRIRQHAVAAAVGAGGRPGEVNPGRRTWFGRGDRD